MSRYFYFPLVVFFLIVGLCGVVPSLLTIDPMRTDPQSQLSPPTATHLMGTDLLGRDVLSRTLHGGRRSLVMAGLTTLLVIIVGLPVGIVAGAASGRVFVQVIVTLINAVLAIPALVMALVVITIMGGSMWGVIIAVSVAQVAPFASVIRAAVLAARSENYVEAAYGLGATRRHVLTQHIALAIRPTIVSYGGVMFAYALLNSAALTFLGLGGEPGVPDWGVILAEGRAAFRVAPWIAFAPGIAITLTVWSMNRIADEVA